MTLGIKQVVVTKSLLNIWFIILKITIKSSENEILFHSNKWY